jgi:phosphoribosylformylglycinamidine (FGAM) synthase-like amidotransferase family enzyme
MFKGMAGTSMGIWVAHGEGQALFPDSSILQRVTDRKLAALRYACRHCTLHYYYNTVLVVLTLSK